MSLALISKTAWSASERMQLQRDRIRERQYTKIGKLTTILLERQMSTAGMSQSRPRYSSPHIKPEWVSRGMEPFSEWQASAWVLLTLDWLHHRHAPTLAISSDRNDLLLPRGLAPLPNIPDPLWVPKQPGEVAPRMPQKLEDRASGRIREKNGRTWLIFQPLTELCVFLGVADKWGFGRIRCATDPADHTHAALLVDPAEPDREGYFPAFFLGGTFQAG